MKTFYSKLVCILAISTLLLSQSAFANQNDAYLNLGALDVRLANNEETLKTNVKSGEAQTHYLRVTNFSDQTKHLHLYVTDASLINQQKHFVATAANQSLSSWVELPLQNFTLKSKESLIIPFKLYAVGKLGIGLHLGALMVQEQSTDTQGGTVKIEKGLRIYATVPGVPQPKISIGNTSSIKTAEQIQHQIQVINSGNTDQVGEVKLLTRNLFGEVIATQSQKVFLTPGTEKTVEFQSNRKSVV